MPVRRAHGRPCTARSETRVVGRARSRSRGGVARDGAGRRSSRRRRRRSHEESSPPLRQCPRARRCACGCGRCRGSSSPKRSARRRGRAARRASAIPIAPRLRAAPGRRARRRAVCGGRQPADAREERRAARRTAAGSRKPARRLVGLAGSARRPRSSALISEAKRSLPPGRAQNSGLMPKRSRQSTSCASRAVRAARRPTCRRSAPDAVGPHSPQACEQDLGVAGRCGTVPARLELGAQLDVVVELAVVDERGAAPARRASAGRWRRSEVDDRAGDAEASSGDAAGSPASSASRRTGRPLVPEGEDTPRRRGRGAPARRPWRASARAHLLRGDPRCPASPHTVSAPSRPASARGDHAGEARLLDPQASSSRAAPHVDDDARRAPRVVQQSPHGRDDRRLALGVDLPTDAVASGQRRAGRPVVRVEDRNSPAAIARKKPFGSAYSIAGMVGRYRTATASAVR